MRPANGLGLRATLVAGAARPLQAAGAILLVAGTATIVQGAV